MKAVAIALAVAMLGTNTSRAAECFTEDEIYAIAWHGEWIAIGPAVTICGRNYLGASSEAAGMQFTSDTVKDAITNIATASRAFTRLYGDGVFDQWQVDIKGDSRNRVSKFTRQQCGNFIEWVGSFSAKNFAQYVLSGETIGRIRAKVSQCN